MFAAVTLQCDCYSKLAFRATCETLPTSSINVIGGTHDVPSLAVRPLVIQLRYE
jgi:hypothetical protein